MRSDNSRVVVALETPSLAETWLAFQRVEDPTPGKNRVHLELVAGEYLEAEVDRLVAAGATLVARRGDESFRWVTLADPDGNVFCVAQPDAH